MTEWWIPLAVAAIAALPGLFALRGQFKRDDADIAGTYRQLLDQELEKRKELTNNCENLIYQLEVCERAIERKDRYIRKLKAYIDLTGGDIPPDEDTRPK